MSCQCVECEEKVKELEDRIYWLEENLHILKQGLGIIIIDGKVKYSRWKNKKLKKKITTP